MIYLVRDEPSRALAQQALKALRVASDRPWRVTLSRFTRTRSLPQNKLLHMWEHVISDDTGQPKEDVHDYIKRHFLGTVEREVFGERIHTPISTTTLDTGAFTVLLDRVQVWAAEELGIVLPQPDSVGWDSLVANYDSTNLP